MPSTALSTRLSRRQVLIGGAAGVSAIALVGAWAGPAQATPPVAADYAALRARWQGILVGADVDGTDTAIQDAVAIIDANATGFASTMITSEPTTYLWDADGLRFSDPTIDAEKARSISARATAMRLAAMAQAHGVDGGYSGDPADLLEKIEFGVQWLLTHHYPGGSPKTGNWFNWELGVPLALNSVLLIVGDLLDGTVVDDTLTSIAYYTSKHFTPAKNLTGANLVMACTVRAGLGALREDDDALALAVSTDKGLPVALADSTGQKDGYHSDGSFIQHEYFAYTGSYGVTALSLAPRMLYLLAGSPWALSPTSTDQVVAWVERTYRPWLFLGNVSSAVRGRSLSREGDTDAGTGRDVVRALAWVAAIAPTPAASAAVAGVIAEAATAPGVDTAELLAYGAAVPDWNLAGLQLLLDAVDATPAAALVDSRVFAVMDRAVHRTASFQVAVAMTSSRIATYECENHENTRGWYTGAGMVSVSNADVDQFNADYWATVDPYRLPGTTVRLHALADEEHEKYRSNRTWVGGAEGSGALMLGMDYAAPAPASLTTAPVTCRKSWLLAGGVVLALGSGVTAGAGADVHTILENRKLPDPSCALVVGGVTQPTSAGWSATFPATSWAHLAGIGSEGIGYIGLQGPGLLMDRTTRTGTWAGINQYGSTDPRTDTYVSIAYDHGDAPVDAKYAYVLLPAATQSATHSLAASLSTGGGGLPSVTVLKNNSEAHAARVGDVLGINVWRAGGLTSPVDGVSCTKPASIVVTRSPGEIEVSVAVPDRGAGPVQVTLPDTVTAVLDDPQGIVEPTSPLTLVIDSAGARGGTFTARVSV